MSEINVSAPSNTEFIQYTDENSRKIHSSVHNNAIVTFPTVVLYSDPNDKDAEIFKALMSVIKDKENCFMYQEGKIVNSIDGEEKVLCKKDQTTIVSLFGTAGVKVCIDRMNNSNNKLNMVVNIHFGFLYNFKDPQQSLLNDNENKMIGENVVIKTHRHSNRRITREEATINRLTSLNFAYVFLNELLVKSFDVISIIKCSGKTTNKHNLRHYVSFQLNKNKSAVETKTLVTKEQIVNRELQTSLKTVSKIAPTQEVVLSGENLTAKQSYDNYMEQSIKDGGKWYMPTFEELEQMNYTQVNELKQTFADKDQPGHSIAAWQHYLNYSIHKNAKGDTKLAESLFAQAMAVSQITEAINSGKIAAAILTDAHGNTYCFANESIAKTALQITEDTIKSMSIKRGPPPRRAIQQPPQ